MSIVNATVIHTGRRMKNRSVMKLAVHGASIAISTLILFLLAQEAKLPLAVASALAAELAVAGNYLLIENCMFTCRKPTFRRFAKFNIASFIGLALNVFVVWYLARLGLYFLAANLIGIAASFGISHAFDVSVWDLAACYEVRCGRRDGSQCRAASCLGR